MAVLSTSTKGKAGLKAAKTAAKHPGSLRVGARAPRPVAKLGLKAGPPIARRRARQRVDRLGDGVRTIGETLATYGPQAAQEFGRLIEPPKPKRTAPRVAAGIVIGAGAMYFLEPENGAKHRKQVAQLVS